MHWCIYTHIHKHTFESLELAEIEYNFSRQEPNFPTWRLQKMKFTGSQSVRDVSETVMWGNAGALANCTVFLLANMWQLVLWDRCNPGLKYLHIFIVQTLMSANDVVPWAQGLAESGVHCSGTWGCCCRLWHVCSAPTSPLGQSALIVPEALSA